MSKHLSAATMPDYFGKRYDSKALRIAAAAIAFIFLIPYTVSVYNGLSRLFGMAFNIPYSVCVIAMAALTGVYVVLGGYMATAINDFIQGIVMMFGIVAVIVVVLVLSASMSTLSSLVLTSSSTLTLDLLKDNVIKDMDKKKQLSWMRVMLVFFIVVIVVIAMVAGLIVVPVVSLVTPKMDSKKLEDIFHCLEEKVLVSKKKSIEE